MLQETNAINESTKMESPCPGVATHFDHFQNLDHFGANVAKMFAEPRVVRLSFLDSAALDSGKQANLTHSLLLSQIWRMINQLTCYLWTP